MEYTQKRRNKIYRKALKNVYETGQPICPAIDDVSNSDLWVYGGGYLFNRFTEYELVKPEYVVFAGRWYNEESRDAETNLRLTMLSLLIVMTDYEDE